MKAFMGGLTVLVAVGCGQSAASYSEQVSKAQPKPKDTTVFHDDNGIVFGRQPLDIDKLRQEHEAKMKQQQAAGTSGGTSN